MATNEPHEEQVAHDHVPPRRDRSSGVIRALSALGGGIANTFLLAAAIFLGATARTPLPDNWNPTAPYDPAAAQTPLTGWKLGRAAANIDLCRAALARGGADATAIEDRVPRPACPLRDAVALERLGEVGLDPADIPCALALRLLAWVHHDLQPLALDILGAPVERLIHYGVYNCRRIRGPSGSGVRMSAHATGRAIDIAGFQLADGRRLTLLGDWTGGDDGALFLRRVQDGLCTRFRQVLGPQYNALHADHFHVALSGSTICR